MWSLRWFKAWTQICGTSGNVSTPSSENVPKESSWFHSRKVALDARTEEKKKERKTALDQGWARPDLNWCQLKRGHRQLDSDHSHVQESCVLGNLSSAPRSAWPRPGFFFSVSQQSLSCEKWQLNEILSKFVLGTGVGGGHCILVHDTYWALLEAWVYLCT